MAQKTANAAKLLIERALRELADNGIPASMLRDQVGSRNLGPAGDTGSGYTPAAHDTAWADVTGTPTTLAGYGITDAASDAELATHEADTTAVHGITDTSTLYRAGGTDVALADGGTGASLSDPNADRILFWDDSAGAVTWLTAGTGLTITTTTIDASGGGSALTVEEVDGSPTDSAVTKIVFPNGTLGIASHVATYTPAGGSVSDGDKGDITVSGSGATWTIDNDVVTYAKMQNVSATNRLLGRATSGAGDTEEITLGTNLSFAGTTLNATSGGTTFPTVAQYKTGTNAVTSVVLDQTPTVGNRLILFSNSTTGQITSVASTNTTWTQVKTYTSGGGSFYAIWVGVVGSSPSATITFTKPGSFNTVGVIEVTDALTPTLGQSATTSSVPGAGITNVTAGHFVIACAGCDNTLQGGVISLSVPHCGPAGGLAAMAVGYAVGYNIFAATQAGGASALILAEIT